MHCANCGKSLEVGCCLRCHPTATKHTHPYLVPREGRTRRTCAELAARDLPQNIPVYYTAMFSPGLGNGPYFVDTNVEHLLARIGTATPDFHRFATIFREGHACRLHLDLDDTRPDRPAIGKAVITVLAFIQRVLLDVCDYDLQTTDWLISQSLDPDKLSVHATSTKGVFKDVTHCRNVISHYNKMVEAAYEAGDPDAKVVCWVEKGKFKHIVDPSIYHHNALLKLPYQHKPGKPTMVPVSLNGTPVVQMTIQLRLLLMSMAHTPDTFSATEFIQCPPMPPVRAPVPAPVHTDVSFDASKHPTLLSALAKNLVSICTGKFVITPSGESAGTTRFYVQFEGKHTCATGTSHDSNNARIVVRGKRVIFKCFSKKCKSFLMDPAPTKPISADAEPSFLSPVLVRRASDNLFTELMDDVEELESDQSVEPIVVEYLASLCSLVVDHWVQVNESKVLYAEKRKKITHLKHRPGMDPCDRKIVGFEWITRDKSNFMQAVGQYPVKVPKLSAKGKLSFTNGQLVDVWLSHPDKVVYHKLTFQPDPDMVGEGEFNVWTGYAINERLAKAYVAKRGLSDDDVLTQVKPWVDHMFHIIGNGNKENFGWIMNWLTCILLNKAKTGTACLLMADHGAGKSIVADLYSSIMGPSYACTLTRSDELTGTFNAHLMTKVLVVSEECTYGGTKKDQGLLKNLVTAPTINVRPLYHPMMVLESRHNLLVISNKNRHVLPIEEKERRYACFYPSSRYSGIQTDEAKAYFDTVMSVSPYLVAYLHYFIWNLPDRWNPRANIPVTECTVDQKFRSVSSATRFILTWLQTTSKERWTAEARDLTIEQAHDRYTEWCEKHKVVTWERESIQSFVGTLKRHLLLTRRRLSPTSREWRLVSNLKKQHLRFATSMGLHKFPMLGGDGCDDPPQPPDLPPSHHQTLMDVVLDGGMSIDQKEERIDHVATVARMRPHCPVGCDGAHPAFIRSTHEGPLEACLETDERAVRYHLYALPLVLRPP